jgi:radical SAM/Cys-rich protein
MKTVPKSKIIPFKNKISSNLPKEQIKVLQINLGRKCNLACTHCHVEASPKRIEEISQEIIHQLIKIIKKFPQIKTVDLTGGAPEMNFGFKSIVEAAKANGKEVIIRSNLTIFFEKGYEYLPEYFAENGLRVVASLPCYLEENVDNQRGSGVYKLSLKALQKLNQLGYGSAPNLIIDLVYNPSMPNHNKFNLPPEQKKLEQDYKQYLNKNFGIKFNNLLTITNLPIGRTKQYLQRQGLENSYLEFLESNFNGATIPHLMCKNQLSIDYLGNVYDCDFNQMENIPATTAKGEKLTVAKLLEMGSLDIIPEVKTANHCYGCTAGSGSSCGGALL